MKKAILTSLYGSLCAFSVAGLNAADAKPVAPVAPVAPVTTDSILTISNSDQIKGAGITIYGNALYLKPTSDKAIVGYEIKSNGVRTLTGTTLRLNGNETWGWEVGLNAELGTSRKFELKANWFYTLSDLSTSDSVPSGGVERIYPVFGYTADLITSVTAMSSNMKVLFNLVDVNLHKRMNIGSAIEIDPFVGVAGGFIGMRLTETYVANDTNTYYGIYGSRYWNIGLNSGINAKWKIAGGFSLFSNVAAAVLFGNYNVKSGLFLTQTGNPYAGVSSDFHAERCNLNLDLGFNWDHFFKDNKWYLSFMAGWKQRIFFNQLTLSGVGVTVPNDVDGNIGLQGLFFGGKVGF